MINTAHDFKNWAWIWSLNAILNCIILVVNLIQNLKTNKHTAANWNSTQQTLSGNFISWTKKPLYVKFLLLEWVMDFIYLKTYCSVSCSSIRKFAELFLFTTDPVLFRNRSPCPIPASSIPTTPPKVEIKIMWTAQLVTLKYTFYFSFWETYDKWKKLSCHPFGYGSVVFGKLSEL